LRFLRSRGVRLPLGDASHIAFGGVDAIRSSRWRLVGLRRSLLGLRPSPGGAHEVFPDVLAGRSEDRPTPPPQACSSFRALSPCLAWAILSWDSSACASHPTCDRASTPGCRFRHPSARRCHASGPVPSLRFLTALTACSARPSQVCCALLPAMRFSVFRASEPRTRRSWVSSAVLTVRFIPLEGFPSSVAVPHRCGRCPPVVAALPIRRAWTVHRRLRSDPEVLAAASVRVLPAWAVALGRSGRSLLSVGALRVRGTQGASCLWSERVRPRAFRPGDPSTSAYGSAREPPVPFHERSHRSGLLSGPGPAPSSFLPRNPLVQSPGSCGGCGRARRGHRRLPGCALFLGRRAAIARMALPSGAAVDESTSAAFHLSSGRLAPIALDLQWILDWRRVESIRVRPLRPAEAGRRGLPPERAPRGRRCRSTAEAVAPLVPCGRGGVWTSALRRRRVPVSACRRSGAFRRDRSTVSGGSWRGASRPRASCSGVAPLADLPARLVVRHSKLVTSVPGFSLSPLPGTISVAGDHPVSGDALRCRRPWASSREQSASGPCSTGESVAFLHRFQRRNALSFHGLCSPSRSSLARSSAGSGFFCLPCGRLPSPAPASGSLGGSAAVREVPLAVARVAARRVCPGKVSHRRGGSGLPRAFASGSLSPSVRCGPSWGS
jgi:hypothetical protein